MMDSTFVLLATLMLTTMIVETSSVVYEPKTLVNSYCPEVTSSMLKDGLDYAATVYRYDLIKPAEIELTSMQALLISLLNCLRTRDNESCTILADCSSRIKQLRSRYVGLWLREDFRFPDEDMNIAMNRLDSLVGAGELVLHSNVLSVFSSLADSYGISLQSKKKSGNLMLELEYAVANNIACEIIALVNEGGNINGLTQSGESLVHLAVRRGSTSSIAVLGFLKADFDVLNAAGATPMEEAINMNSVPSIKELILAGAKIKKQLLEGNSYLHIAATSCKNEALRALLEAGLEPDVRNHLGNTSLQLAVKVENVNGTEILLERYANRSSLISEEEKSLLHITVVSSNVDMFKAFIKCRNLLDLRFENNDTIVHLIVRSNNSIEMLKVLRGQTTPLNIRNDDGLAPLHIATDPSVVETLLEMGVDVNITTRKGKTALHIASSKGYLNVVKVLVQHGAGVDIQDDQNETALMAATKSKMNIVVIFLLYSGADLTIKNNQGRTALHYASKEGCIDCALTLLDNGGKVDERDTDKFTSLHLAARRGRMGVVTLLLERGADLTAKSGSGMTPLMEASFNGHLDVVKLLIDRGASINDKEDGWTALHYAAQEGEVDVVTLLLDRGASMNDKNNDGSTAVHLAARGGNMGVMTLLLERGADLLAKSDSGLTPLMEASYYGYSDVVKLLIDRGAPINDMDKDGWTALHYAAQGGKVDVVTLLLDRGASINDKNNDGSTPVHLAARGENMGVVTLLLDRGANLTAKSYSGMTPLMEASYYGYSNVVKLLIDQGAAINDKNENGTTALHYAAQEGKVDIVTLLLDRGANLTAKSGSGRTPLMIASENSQIDLVKLLIDRRAPINDMDKDGWTALRYSKNFGKKELSEYLESKGGIE
ncbi:unnamed protein product [Nezara viridula]|uniref:Uncharacterized protein n=1 Tax=Nezara viridula TaxID=85310 RepID=A0A9P0EG18_NEZVI|nr:unnamed protein product [Nezara viridula]